MRYSEYLATLPAAAQRRLADDLTLGCGRVALAARLQREEPRTAAMLGTLAAAHACLRAALAVLDAETGPDEASPGRGASADGLPEDWATLAAAADPLGVETWLTMAGEMARDLIGVTEADAGIAAVRKLLDMLLDALATVRDDVLSPP